MAYSSKPLIDRFMDSVMPEPMSGCWLWLGGCTSVGYGAISHGGVQQLAHRVAFELFRGCIPSGMVVCHKCDTRACANPDHLFVGTQQDNINDMKAKGRSVSRSKLKCGSCGRLKIGDNLTTIWNAKARCFHKTCRHCSREACRRYREKRQSERRMKERCL